MAVDESLLAEIRSVYDSLRRHEDAVMSGELSQIRGRQVLRNLKIAESLFVMLARETRRGRPQPVAGPKKPTRRRRRRAFPK